MIWLAYAKATIQTNKYVGYFPEPWTLELLISSQFVNQLAANEVLAELVTYDHILHDGMTTRAWLFWTRYRRLMELFGRP